MKKLKRSVKNRLVLMAIVAACIFLPITLIKLQKFLEEQENASRERPPTAVTVVQAEREDWRSSIGSVGSLVAEQGINVTAPLPGTTIKIHFESGQDIGKGEPLISQDIGVPSAELAGLEAKLQLRRSQFKRASKLYESRQISKSDLDDSAALLKEAQAAVDAKSAFIARKTVYAPFDGTLGIRMIDLGSYLNPGDPIVPLYMRDPIHVDYSLPEKFISRLFVGQEVEVNVSAYPGKKFIGKITAYDPVIDSRTRNIKIRATIKNSEGFLKPGMFAKVSTFDAIPKSVIILPNTAVSYSPYGNTLFVIKEVSGGLVAQKEQVKIGEVKGEYVQITAGIKVGERVVAVGQNKLRNGMRVSISLAVSTKTED